MPLVIQIQISSSTPASESAMIGQVKDVLMGNGYVLDVEDFTPEAVVLDELGNAEAGRATVKTYTS